MTPINPNHLDAAFAMCDLARWGAKGSIVALVRLSTLGDVIVSRFGAVLLPREQIVSWTGLDGRYAHRMLDELVADRVLLCERGRGRRAHAYRINPEVGQWRNVPWRRKEPGEVPIWLAYIGDDRGARGAGGAVAARPSAQLEGPLLRAPARNNDGPYTLPLEVPPPSEKEPPPPPSSSSKECEEEEVRWNEDHPGWEVVDAVCRMTTRSLFGQPRRRLMEALDGASPERVAVALAAVAANRGLGPPQVAEAVVAALRLSRPAPAAGLTRAKRVTYLRAVVACDPDDLVAADELAELERHEGDDR